MQLASVLQYHCQVTDLEANMQSPGSHGERVRKDSERLPSSKLREPCFPCLLFHSSQIAGSCPCIDYQGLKEGTDPTGAFSECANTVLILQNE